MQWDYDVIIHGEPASSKNQRRIVGLKNRQPRLIKSAKALGYAESFRRQCKRIDPMLDGDLYIHIDAYYASRRPDLSCLEIIKDLLQGYAYENDRQIKMESSVWNLSKEEPRVRVRIRRIVSAGCTETYSSTLCGMLDLS